MSWASVISLSSGYGGQYLASWSSCLVSLFPTASLIGFDWVNRFANSFFVASWVISFCVVLLPIFFSRAWSFYELLAESCNVARPFSFSALVLLLLRVCLSFFLRSIFLGDLSEIHSLCWCYLGPSIPFNVSIHACYLVHHTSSTFHSSSSSSWRSISAWLESVSSKKLTVVGSCSKARLNLGDDLGFLEMYLLSLILTLAATRPVVVKCYICPSTNSYILEWSSKLFAFADVICRIFWASVAQNCSEQKLQLVTQHEE